MKAKKTMSKTKPKPKTPKSPLITDESVLTADRLRKEIVAQVGQKLADDNPFISSPQFVELMKGIAIIPKALLVGSRGPVEFMNALLSTMVTMLSNIPDALWNQLRTRITDDGSATSEFFKHADAIRSYNGKQVVTFDGDDHPMPRFTANPPTTPV